MADSKMYVEFCPKCKKDWEAVKPALIRLGKVYDDFPMGASGMVRLIIKEIEDDNK